MFKKEETSVIKTILGKGCVVGGDFTCETAARIDGTVEGNVKVSGQLIVGAGGVIHGDVEATSIVIGGEIIGNVIAPERAELITTAKLIGDLKTGAIVIDENAIFQGKCDMNQEEADPAMKAKKRKGAAKTAKRSAKAALVEALAEVKESTEETVENSEEQKEQP
ncbi:MAG: polymer-forming cytoskeletal protein [Lachnospiraceae bacterium]|nr:polymer-forming cytoskeletal protein [Lachnospiraceae bacterium]